MLGTNGVMRLLHPAMGILLACGGCGPSIVPGASSPERLSAGVYRGNLVCDETVRVGLETATNTSEAPASLEIAADGVPALEGLPIEAGRRVPFPIAGREIELQYERVGYNGNTLVVESRLIDSTRVMEGLFRATVTPRSVDAARYTLDSLISETVDGALVTTVAACEGVVQR